MKKQAFVFAVWFVAVSIPMMYLMGFHTFAFTNKPLEKLTSAPEIHKGPEWQLIHILSSRCACSKKVARHLLERGLFSGTREIVYILDDEEVLSESKLKEVGFQVVRLNGDQAYEKYDINAAPQLVVLNKDLQVQYSGGYKDSRVETYDDEKILNALKNNETFASHPIFGCANGTRTAELIDPWGVKY